MMTPVSETSDGQVMELLRQQGPSSVNDVAEATHVTPTAVRQRLTRLMGQGLIEREVNRGGRGRPSHRYMLTDKARRMAGSNFADLAIILWNEIRGVADPKVRQGLLDRIAKSLARLYDGQVEGGTLSSRMRGVGALFADRGVSVEVGTQGASDQPVLRVLDCPYPQLAEQDRGICAVEKMLFSQMVDQSLRLSQCRLDGDNCCQFETN